MTLAACALALGCLEYSPHALPTDSSERDLNARAMARLVGAPPAGPLRIAVVGDTQRYFDDTEDVVAAIDARDDVHLVVQVGDFTHLGTLLEFRLAKDLLDRLRVPYLVVAGYHDFHGNGRAIYREMFGPTDFAFTLGRVRLVFFDSNSSVHDPGGRVPDLEWLAGALAPSPDHDRALAFSHVAAGAPDFDGALTAPLLALLAASDVELSIHGHAHKHDAYEHDGVRVVIVDSVDHRSYVLLTQRADGGFDAERVAF